MPKRNCILNNLEKIHLSNYIDTALYNYIKGVRCVMPTISVERCIGLFCKENKIYDYDEANLKTRYFEMQKRTLESEKTPANYLKNGNT